jgi:hypothetical protein
MNSNSQHLNHTQLCDLLLAGHLLPSAPSAHQDHVLHDVASEAQIDLHQDHLRQCLICSAEFEVLRSSVAGFQASSEALANRELARRSLPVPFRSVFASRSRGYATPAFFWAATAVLALAVLPFGIVHSLNPFASPKPQPIAQSHATATPASTTESDEALLDSINQELSADVPTPMQPLAGAAASETSSAQRTN